MRVIESVVVLAVTLGAVASAANGMDVPVMTEQARRVAAQETCRSVELAVVAFAGERGHPPADIGQVRAYLRGDVSAYRIVDGAADGPGCGSR